VFITTVFLESGVMELKLDFHEKPEDFGDVDRLKILSLRGCCEWVTDTVLQDLSVSGVIEVALLFRCWRISDEGIRSLARRNGNSLVQLDISGCMNLTDFSLRSVNRYCPGLLKLDLTRCLGISDIGINYIATDKLEELILYADSELSGSSYDAIASACTSLKRLDLCGHKNVESNHLCAILDTCGNRLEYLNLSWCIRLDDGIIDHIIRTESLRSIKYLSLFGIKNLTQMDALVAYLQDVSCLSQLDMRGIPAAQHLTEKDCTELRTRIPRLSDWKLHH
jgi:F-box/leucine-rich repeat protein 2/20